MNEKPVIIIQTGHMRTGTTLLVNLLYPDLFPNNLSAWPLYILKGSCDCLDNMELQLLFCLLQKKI